jgi:hypothetical protein
MFLQISTDIDVLHKSVESVKTFNDIEMIVNKWQEDTKEFVESSHVSKAITNLCECAKKFLKLCNDLDSSSLNLKDGSMPELSSLNADIDENFVLCCMDLVPSCDESSSFAELTPFQKELAVIFGHYSEKNLTSV